VAAPNARLQHAAAPDRIPRSCAALCTAMASENPPTRPSLMLMIWQDPFDGGERVSSISNRLVKTDRRIEPLLQHGVVIEVVVPEGLLDHQQVERIKGHQVIGIAQLVAELASTLSEISGQRSRTPLKNIHIPARLALELDAADSPPQARAQ